jgi:hypothetical protein
MAWATCLVAECLSFLRPIRWNFTVTLTWASVRECHQSERLALERFAVRPRSRAGQLYVAGRRGWTVNPSFPSTLTAPVFPPSKSPEARRWPVANS